MRIRTCELARDACVHFFNDIEIGGEEDVEIALVDLNHLLEQAYNRYPHELGGKIIGMSVVSGNLQEAC
jgi:ABC-type oligopeptide transport system ATPase subunit